MESKFWTEEKLNLLLESFNQGMRSSSIAKLFNCKSKEIVNKINRMGLRFGCNRIDESKYIIKNCKHCNTEFKSLISEHRKFCTSSCNTTYHNLGRNRHTSEIKNFCEIFYCEYCKNVHRYKKQKFCSSTCSGQHRKEKMFELIKNGDKNQTSKSYKKYLIHTYGEKCMNCGWNKKNIYSNKIPIELEHKDGNSENNSLDNLELLCPNCHSLTKTYKALNIGNGRHSRRERYKNGKSF